MEKKFRKIVSLYTNAEKIEGVAYQIIGATEEIDDVPTQEVLKDIGDKLVELGKEQKNALRKKFFTNFTPTPEELKRLKERFPKAAPLSRAYQCLGVPQLCKWLDENPEMLGSQHNDFLRLDYVVFKQWYDTVKQCKLLLQHLEAVEFEMVPEWGYQLHRIIREEERLLHERFALDFPTTYAATCRYPDFSFTLFYELLKENPQLMVMNKNAFLCYLLDMEACNRPVPNELLMILKTAVLS